MSQLRGRNGVMVQVLSRAQLQEKHPVWKYFGRVDRKESVMYWQRRLGGCLVVLECFPPTDLRPFSIWLHSAADYRAHI